MNPVLNTILNRKSVRAYEDRPIDGETRAAILQATLRAPTAGNMLLYSIVEIEDQAIKDTLARTCDNQPFIAKAPWVLLFLADYQRWYDYFIASGVPALCEKRGDAMRKPEEGDLFLACCDALIAAQTAVVAAESLGLGSCYIGDIIENYETHKQLLGLPQYVFPIALVCFGYPTKGQIEREMTPRFDPRFVVYQDRYRRLSAQEFEEMFRDRQARAFQGRQTIEDCSNFGQVMYTRKYSAEFSIEMSRSARAILQAWREETP